jgi:hypothetical protein
MGGSGAEVLRRMGAIVVTLPGGEIMPALSNQARLTRPNGSGPGSTWQSACTRPRAFTTIRPGSGFSLGINKAIWESFDASDRRVFEAVAACEYARSLAEFNANNALWLRKLRDENTVKILKFDDSLLKVMLTISKDVVADWVVQLRVQGALPAGIQGARRRSDYDTGVLTVHDLRITGDQASRGYLRRYQWSRCQRDWLDQPWGYYLPRAGLFVPDVDPAVQSTNLPFRYL